MTALSEARAELRELENQRANLVAEAKALDDARAPIQKRYDANCAKRRKRTVVVNAANEHVRRTMDEIAVGSWDTKALIGKKPKEVVDALTTGGAKVGIQSTYQSISYSARGLSQRVRTPDPADLRAWDKATKARDRARDALSRAEAALKEAARLAYENGTKVTLDALLVDIGRDTVLHAAALDLPTGEQKRHELTRLLDPMFGALPRAKGHVEHLAAKEEAPDCVRCKQIAQDTAATNERVARIKSYPRKRWTCPDHGPRLAHINRERARWGTGEDGNPVRDSDNAPIVYCPVDWKRYIDKGQLDIDDKARVKAEAKAAKAAAKRKPGKPAEQEGEVVDFICPNPDCDGEVVTSEVEDGIVVCDMCDVEWDIDRVKVVSGKKAA